MSVFHRLVKPLILLAPAVALATVGSGLGRADAPTGRYVLQSGTVYDTKTLLTWQQMVAPYTPYTWSQAASQCAGLSLNGAGWRMPSVNELQTIVDETRKSPSIDPTAFPGAQATVYWTSSLSAGVPSHVWGVQFDYYGLTASYDTTNVTLVRCVR